MDGCQYKEVSNDEKSTKWQPFFRQLLVSSGVWVVYFGTGLCMGAPTVFIPQIRKEANSTQAISQEMASWLSSIFGYTALPWVFILSGLARLIGRKKTFTIVTLNSIAMFTAFYFSLTPTHLLYSELAQGITHGSSITVSIIVISEYASPRYRGMFLTIKSATLLWGIWISNTIGTFFHWRLIPAVGFICSIYPFTTVLFWPESPHWLASSGRFEECKKAHRWLKGTDDTSEKELDSLIKSQMNKTQKNKSLRISFKSINKTISSREFYIPLLLSTLMVSQYHFSGKFVCSMYSIEILKTITESEHTAYMGMLILDGVTVFSMYIGCLMTRVMKRRTLLLISSSIGILFLYIISLYLYLIKMSIITENKFLSIIFLSSFSLSISCGPMIMATSIYGELIPLRFKSLSVIIIALIFNISHATLLKISPYIFKSFGMHGTFFFYGLSATILTILIYKYLPETKDKTLQEIEDYFKGKQISMVERTRLTDDVHLHKI